MDPRPLTSPAADRNLPPLVEALAPRLPAAGLVLELASGAGQHAAAFARAFPRLSWQPSDRDPAGLASIEAWRRQEGLANLRPALALDLAAPDWLRRLAERPAAAFAANVTHIAPWAVSQGLLAGLGRLLPEDGRFFLYGPFLEAGRPTAPSNQAFDRDLRRRDAAWGLRSLEALDAAAAACGLERAERLEMPANNLLLAYRRRAG